MGTGEVNQGQQIKVWTVENELCLSKNIVCREKVNKVDVDRKKREITSSDWSPTDVSSAILRDWQGKHPRQDDPSEFSASAGE
jgi:hypothetical protein